MLEFDNRIRHVFAKFWSIVIIAAVVVAIRQFALQDRRGLPENVAHVARQARDAAACRVLGGGAVDTGRRRTYGRGSGHGGVKGESLVYHKRS